MLDMVAYDLHKPRDYSSLARGIRVCGSDAYNLDYAPWFVETELPPLMVLQALVTHLGRQKDDLLILGLPSGTGAAEVHRGHQTVRWLQKHGLRFGGANRSGIVGIVYTLHRARLSDYQALTNAIEATFPDHCKPVNALWFLATDRSPAGVLDDLTAYLPNRHPDQKDELLALEIPRGRVGKSQRLTPGELSWFRDHQVYVN